MKSDGHITIETTSKKYKGRMLLAVLGMIVAVIWGMCSKASADIGNQEPDYTVPAAIFIGSIVLWIVTKIQIWWNHG